MLPLDKGELGERFEQAFAALDLADELAIHARKRLLTAPATADLDPKWQPKGPAVCAHAVPEEAMIVCDLHPPAQLRPQLASGLALELASSLGREREKKHTRMALKIRCKDAGESNGEVRLAGYWRRDDELVPLRRGTDCVLFRIGPDIRHRPL